MTVRIPYFRVTVPNTGAVPAAGSVPTTLPSVSKPRPPGTTHHVVQAPLPRTSVVLADGRVTLPGSAPSVLDPLVSSGALASMSSGHISARPVDQDAPVVILEDADDPADRETVLTIEAEPAAPEGATHYPRDPIRRHRRDKSQRW